MLLDLLAERLQFVADLVAAERRQTLQAQIENGACLLVRKHERAVGAEHMAGVGNQRYKRGHVSDGPAPVHEPLARRRGIGGRADEPDHRVDVGDGDGKPDQDVGAVARLAEQMLRAPRDHFFAEVDEGLDETLEREGLGPPAVERQRLHAEVRLQRREAVELVQHHIGHRLALQLDHDADTVAVGLVTQIRDALDAPLAHELGDLLDHRGLVHLIGNLGDDDRLAVFPDLFHDAHARA